MLREHRILIVSSNFTKKILEIKNAVIEIKKAFNRIISKLDIAEERINEHEDIPLVISKIKCKKKRNRIDGTKYPITVEQLLKCNKNIKGVKERKENA